MPQRSYQRHERDDPDAYGPDGLLKDGHAIRVPVSMMDSRTTWIEDAKRSTDAASERLGPHNRPDARITNGAGDSGLALHRPGYRVADGVPRDHSHYAGYDAEIATAYRNVGAGEREALGQRVDRQEDAGSVKDDRDSAYQEFENRIQNAWRKP
jgi:hypothetical protein